MNPVSALLSAVIHLSNFVAPALVCGFFVACAGSLLGSSRNLSTVMKYTLVNAAAGLAVLLAGLIFFGRDGKMATYAAFIVALALSQTVLQSGKIMSRAKTARRGR